MEANKTPVSHTKSSPTAPPVFESAVVDVSNRQAGKPVWNTGVGGVAPSATAGVGGKLGAAAATLMGVPYVPTLSSEFLDFSPAESALKGRKVVFICCGLDGLDSKRFTFMRSAFLGVRTFLVEAPTNSLALAMEKEGLLERFIKVDMRPRPSLAAEVVKAIRKLEVEVGVFDGICTFWDDAVALCARVAEAMGLRGSSPQSVDIAHDKHRTRQCMRDAGLPTPSTFLVKHEGDLAKAAAAVPLPAIVKPMYGACSLGVQKVSKIEDLLPTYRNCVKMMEEFYEEGELMGLTFTDKASKKRQPAPTVAASPPKATDTTLEIAESEVAVKIEDTPLKVETGATEPSVVALKEEEAGTPSTAAGLDDHHTTPSNEIVNTNGDEEDDDTGSTDSSFLSSHEGESPINKRKLSIQGSFCGDASLRYLVMEEFLDGDEVDVDVVLQNGEVLYCCVVDDWPQIEPWFAEMGNSCPSILPASIQGELAHMAIESLNAMKFRDGVYHVELKATSKGPRLIEINPRMGGGPVWRLHKMAYGVDFVEETLLSACGITRERILMRSKHCVACGEKFFNKSFIIPEDFCQVVRAMGLFPNVVEAVPLVEAGQQIVGIEDAFPTRTARFVVLAHSPIDAKRYATKLLDMCDIPKVLEAQARGLSA